MNRLFSIKTVSVALLAAFLLTVSAWSIEKSHEMTIKTNAKEATSRNKVETITSFLKGVQDVKFDEKIKTNLVVTYNPDMTNPDMVVYVLKLLGYSAEQEGSSKDVSDRSQGDGKNLGKDAK